MRKYLLSEKGNFYKANLHCHTTVSDGSMTPKEVKDLYKSKGYSIVAYTDHDVMIPHNDLNDDGFLALNGYEIEVNDDMIDGFMKCCHFCLIALEPDNLKQVCWHRENYLFCNAVNYRDKVDFYEDEPDYIRTYTPECITDMMKKGREHGFFVTYNHPGWSLENYSDYTNYHGMHAMEIVNGCVVGGYDDYNTKVYDDILRNGERIFCIAADDNHGTHDACVTFTMIKAERLDYKSITNALINGDFYASTGPEIRGLWYEDGKIHIETSDVVKIAFSFNNRHAVMVKAEEGKTINVAETVLFDDSKYVRITVTDKSGEKAYTNAYYLEDILSK